MGNRRKSSPRFASLLLLAWLVASGGCQSCLKRKPIATVPRLAYPSCGDEPLRASEELASGVLRSGPDMREQGVVERYTLTQRACLRIFTVRQEWSRQVTDVEVVYDEHYRPLRAWKRMAVPGFEQSTEDIRLYEFRGAHPTMVRRSSDGVESYQFEGGAPVAVVAPGRSLIGAWIRAGALEAGEVARGPVFDFRPDRACGGRATSPGRRPTGRDPRSRARLHLLRARDGLRRRSWRCGWRSRGAARGQPGAVTDAAADSQLDAARPHRNALKGEAARS